MHSLKPIRSMAFAAALFLPGCWWNVPDNDPGQQAWVRQVVPTVLGRRAKNADEIRALARIADNHGREAVLDLLYAQPEFATYWSFVLADMLHVQAEGAMGVDASCFGTPMLEPYLDDELAYHLAYADMDDIFCPTWEAPPQLEPLHVLEETEARIAETVSTYEHWWVDDVLAELPAPTGTLPTIGGDLERGMLGGNGADNGFVLRDSLPTWDEPESSPYPPHEPSWGPCYDFNMTDVLRASIRGESLHGLLRAYLPVLATFTPDGTEYAKRASLGAVFSETYLDRDTSCMACHTSTFSTTDARPLNDHWDRFAPIWVGLPVPVDLEGSLFHDGRQGAYSWGGQGGAAAQDNLEGLFRSDVHGQGGFRPLGLAASCVTDQARGYDGFRTSVPADPLSRGGAFAGVIGDDRTVLDLADHFARGAATFRSWNLSLPTASFPPGTNAARGATLYASCTGCHFSGAPDAPDLDTRAATVHDKTLTRILRFGSGRMPAQSHLSEQDAWDVVAFLRTGTNPETGQPFKKAPAMSFDDPEHALAVLVASNVVNAVFAELFGERLVLEHGFPRNEAQANALAKLTSVLMQQWSLRDVLDEILLSGAYPRRSPARTPAGTPQYQLPMLAEPWAEVLQPTQAGHNANSEADHVHRYSISNLLLSVHHALAPKLGREDVAGVEAYPSLQLRRRVGDYTSVRSEGQDAVLLDHLLGWEAEVASCRKPYVVRARDVDPGATDPNALLGRSQWQDWIDVLLTDLTANGGDLEQGLRAIKERLVNDPTMNGTEMTAIAQWLGRLDHAPTEDALRDYCGVLLKSPQFLMQGLDALDPLPMPSPEDPDSVCLEGEDCTYDDFCAHYAESGAMADLDVFCD